jgi:hypothetical protein
MAERQRLREEAKNKMEEEITRLKKLMNFVKEKEKRTWKEKLLECMIFRMRLLMPPTLIQLDANFHPLSFKAA